MLGIAISELVRRSIMIGGAKGRKMQWLCKCTGDGSVAMDLLTNSGRINAEPTESVMKKTLRLDNERVDDFPH